MAKKRAQSPARTTRSSNARRSSGSSAITTAIVVVVVALIVTAYFGVRSAQQAKDEAAAHPGRSGESSGPPWPVPVDPAAGVKAAGLVMAPEATVEHYHAHLQVTVDGEPVGVPANIGIDPPTGQMSALHTHTPDGILHVEAPKVGDIFTLGQLFAEWNVKLTKTQLGSLRAGNGKELVAFVDGKRFTGDPAAIRLADKRAIAIEYGPAGSIKPPKKYTFRKGL